MSQFVGFSCVFVGNHARSGGAIVAALSLTLGMYDSSFMSNNAVLDGGSIAVSTADALMMGNVSFVGNVAGTGGALAIGVGDRVMMLEYSTYSVISPEGCASILWKSAEKAEDAAEAMGITAKRLKELELIDDIVREPLGSAYRDIDTTARNIKQALVGALESTEKVGLDKLLAQRYERLMSYGNFIKEEAS